MQEHLSNSPTDITISNPPAAFHFFSRLERAITKSFVSSLSPTIGLTTIDFPKIWGLSDSSRVWALAFRHRAESGRESAFALAAVEWRRLIMYGTHHCRSAPTKDTRLRRLRSPQASISNFISPRGIQELGCKLFEDVNKTARAILGGVWFARTHRAKIWPCSPAILRRVETRRDSCTYWRWLILQLVALSSTN